MHRRKPRHHQIPDQALDKNNLTLVAVSFCGGSLNDAAETSRYIQLSARTGRRVFADPDKLGSKPPPKDENSKSKDLREQLEDAPPKHAEGRSQFDYLRRLADEIDQLDDENRFAENGVVASLPAEGASERESAIGAEVFMNHADQPLARMIHDGSSRNR